MGMLFLLSYLFSSDHTSTNEELACLQGLQGKSSKNFKKKAQWGSSEEC